jgi:hypothetical protein
MNGNTELQQPKRTLTAINPSIADSELVYNFYSAVCDSLGVSVIPFAQLDPVWKARRLEAAAQAEQPAAMPSMENPSVSLQRQNGHVFVGIVSRDRGITVRTQDGTAEELRALAKELQDDATKRLRRAAFVLAGAEELERAAQAKKVA